MEIILISECKLKVALCEDDLRNFDIKADELDYSNTETKRMLWDILSRAKHKTGFDTDGQRVLVQLYPSKDGGCEMFVTKIGLLDDSYEDKKDMNGYEKLASQIKKNKKTASQKRVQSAFSFDNIEELLRLCRRLNTIGYIGDSSAYRGDNGKHYLFLSDIEAASYTPLDEFSFVSEYGSKENCDMLKNYLLERGSPICEVNAVAILCRL